MKIYVDNFIWFYKDDCPDQKIVDNCRKTFTYANPEFFMLQAMGRWTGNIKRSTTAVQENDQVLALPRGTGKYLSTLCKASGIDFEIVDRRIFKNQIDVRFKQGVELRSEQNRALSELLPNQQGSLEAPCGAGKTVLMLGAIVELKQPTIILVHTIELLNQWKEQIESKLEGDFTLGVLGGNQKKLGDLTIATVQTLYRYEPKKLKELAKNFGCLIQDEAHHVSARTFTHVINYFPAKYRFGVTATPKRKDKQEPLMFDVMGKIFAKITDEELVQQNKITSAAVEWIPTNFNTALGVDQWVHVVTQLVNNQQRNELIINKVVQDWNDGHFILVLSDRVDHCRTLHKRLQQKGMNSRLLLGEVSKEEREKVRKAALQQKLDVIVGTTVADEGLDIPTLSSLHLTTPCNNKPKVQQRTGRIRRVDSAKQVVPVIRDYVDIEVDYFEAIGHSRYRWYQSWGFDVAAYPENPR